MKTARAELKTESNSACHSAALEAWWQVEVFESELTECSMLEVFG
jgi:hypothetical protein